jgi:putative transposase
MFSLFAALIAQLRHAFADRSDLILENLALRQQLALHQRKCRRLKLNTTDRLFWVCLSRIWRNWRSALLIVQPETVIGWHRQAWKRYWSWKSQHRRSGRPRISQELRRLITTMARENPLWGSQRIRGELMKLGFEISAETVRRYMHEARRRPPSQTWRTFLSNHSPEIWACDFFTVPTLFFSTLYVFFFIEHGRRRLVHFNVTAHPTADWVWRQLFEATPWGEQPRFLIRDRDACFGGQFIARARVLGIEVLLTPFRCPQANGIAERMVGTFRQQCLDHVIVLNERHLRGLLREYVDHYNHARPHRTLGLRAPMSGPSLLRSTGRGRVISRPILGGLHHEYEWEAA